MEFHGGQGDRTNFYSNFIFVFLFQGADNHSKCNQFSHLEGNRDVDSVLAPLVIPMGIFKFCKFYSKCPHKLILFNLRAIIFSIYQRVLSARIVCYNCRLQYKLAAKLSRQGQKAAPARFGQTRDPQTIQVRIGHWQVVRGKDKKM